MHGIKLTIGIIASYTEHSLYAGCNIRKVSFYGNNSTQNQLKSIIRVKLRTALSIGHSINLWADSECHEQRQESAHTSSHFHRLHNLNDWFQ